jgi:transketolase
MFLTSRRKQHRSFIAGMTEAKSRTGKGKPVCVLLHTEMGNGVDFMMNTHAWHGKALMMLN